MADGIENIVFDDNSAVYCLIFAKFSTKIQNQTKMTGGRF